MNKKKLWSIFQMFWKKKFLPQRSSSGQLYLPTLLRENIHSPNKEKE